VCLTSAEPRGVAGVLSAPAAAAAADAQVGFVCCDYNPAAVTINVGESVTWAPGAGNTFDPLPGGTGHPLAPAAGQGEAFGRSGGAAPHSYRFATPGTYLYYCMIHGSTSGSGAGATVSGMSGKVVVIDPLAASGPLVAPTMTAPDTSKPRVRLVIPTPLTTRLSIRSNEAGRAKVRLTAGTTLLARGTADLPAAGTRRVTLKRTAAGRRALARTGRVTATLTVKVRDAAGNVTVVRRKVILRR